MNNSIELKIISIIFLILSLICLIRGIVGREANFFILMMVIGVIMSISIIFLVYSKDEKNE